MPANEIIGQPPGAVFVHRNIANQVISTDFNCSAVIQYAVSVLKVKHIIVCGHYDCGGVKASLEAQDFQAPLCNWIRNVRDTYRLHRDELNKLPDLWSRQRRLVELNVIEQCVNLLKTSTVQQARVQSRRQKVIAGSGVTFTEVRACGPTLRTMYCCPPPRRPPPHPSRRARVCSRASTAWCTSPLQARHGSCRSISTP